MGGSPGRALCICVECRTHACQKAHFNCCAALGAWQGGMAQLQKARKCPDLSWVQRFQVRGRAGRRVVAGRALGTLACTLLGPSLMKDLSACRPPS